MIDTLTDEQQKQLTAHIERYFEMATSTKPADRPCAEAAARRMAEIAGVKIQRVVWVASPFDGARAYEAEYASLRASLRDSLCDSLRDSPWVAFYSFARAIGVQYAPESQEKLRLHEEIGASAFALWILPGVAILCERPAKCDVQNKRLVGIEWRVAEGEGTHGAT